MITLGSIAIAFFDLILLALIGRDAWLRTLEGRRRVLTDADTSAIRAIDERCGRVEASLKDLHDRTTVLERRQPGPRRA